VDDDLMMYLIDNGDDEMPFGVDAVLDDAAVRREEQSAMFKKSKSPTTKKPMKIRARLKSLTAVKMTRQRHWK
jgi:hypothetical protein